MKQPHIQLDESLNVRYAILPGDPRRAERIASHMSEVEDLGMNREYRSLVGTYRGAADRRAAARHEMRERADRKSVV